MSSENLREEIDKSLANLRQRIELEDRDFHYDALLEAEDQILSHLKSQIEQMELTEMYQSFNKEGVSHSWLYHEGQRDILKAILSKLQ